MTVTPINHRHAGVRGPEKPRGRAIYVPRLQSTNADDIPRLRWILKILGRRFGLRCLSIREEAQP